MSSADNRPVFVILTAKTCKYCLRFKADWDLIAAEIKAQGLVRIVEIDVSTMGTPVNPRIVDEKGNVSTRVIYPVDFDRWVGWYPSFYIFSASSWNTNQTPLDGVIFDGQMVEGEPRPNQQLVPSAANLTQWISQEAPKFSTGSVMYLLNAGTQTPSYIEPNPGPDYVKTKTTGPTMCRRNQYSLSFYTSNH